MEYPEFKQQVQSGLFRPAYLLTGFGPAEVRKAQELFEKAKPGTVRERWTAPDSVAEVLVSARSLPMWGEHKLIVIDQADRLSEKGRSNLLGGLVAYLGDPTAWATLVFLCEKSPPPAGLKPLTACVAVVTPPRISVSSLSGWVRRTLAGAGIEIESEALDLLLQICREDWVAIEQELEKVAAAFPPGSRVGAEQLQFLVETKQEESVFDLLRLIADGQTDAALNKLARLLGNARRPREEVLHLWYWLYRQARELTAMREIVRRGLGAEAMETVGLRPRAQGILRRQSEKFPKSRLRKMLEALEQVDRQLKSSYTALPRTLLERYIIGLRQAPPHRR